MIIHIHLNAMKEQDCVSSCFQLMQNIVKHVKCNKILSNMSNAAKYCQTCQMQQNIVEHIKCSKIL